MAHDIHMDREKAPESENFQTLFLQMGNQITHDPGGHAPDGVAPVEPHRDLYLAAVPRVIPGNPNRFIGENLYNISEKKLMSDDRMSQEDIRNIVKSDNLILDSIKNVKDKYPDTKVMFVCSNKDNILTKYQKPYPYT